MKKFLIIDGNSILNRAFYAVRALSTKDGRPTNAVFGFLNILFKYIESEKPDGVCAAFDLRAPTFRHKFYKEYKAQRKGMPDELAQQLAPVKDILKAFGYPVYELEGFEADDIIGTFSKKCEDGYLEVKDDVIIELNLPEVEANKEATIDVSSYVAPVEIEPTDGKDVMEKATVTLTNVPVISQSTVATIDVSTYTEPVEITPESGYDATEKAIVTLSNVPVPDVVQINKDATVDVSTYDPANKPVITPDSGYDTMAQSTITLTNVPALEANKSVTIFGTVSLSKLPSATLGIA